MERYSEMRDMMELADKYSKAAIVSMFRIRQNITIRKQIKNMKTQIEFLEKKMQYPK